MKANRVRRNFWMPSEIEMMLKLLKKLHQSRGTISTSHNAFVQIANKMKKCGFPNKTALQIRRKWFQMKSAYLCYKRGNEERLLLIPECFRQTIAQFVDAEAKYHYKLPNLPAPKSIEDLEAQPTAGPTPIPVKSKPIVLSPLKITPPTQKAIQIHKNEVASDEMKSVYEQMLANFVANSKKSHKLMVNDFKRMSDKLLAYQQECHMIRDANVRAFLEDAKFNFDS